MVGRCVRLKQWQCANEMDRCRGARSNRHESRRDQRREDRGVAQKIVVRFVIEVVAADVAKRIRQF